MATAEARTAWQRAANRYLVQEDAKRAPKLACCPSSTTQQNDRNSGNDAGSEVHLIPGFMPLNWNPMNSNLSPDTKWWLQLQPNFGHQKDFTCEHLIEDGGEMKKKAEANCEPPCMVSTTFVKHGSDMRGIKGDYCYQDKDPVDFKPPKPFSDIDSPWTQGNIHKPWWQVADEDELASLVAQTATQRIENCNLPRPTQIIHVHRDPLSGLETLSAPLGEKINPGLLTSLEYEKINYNAGSTDEKNWSFDGVGRLLHDKDKLYSTDHARCRNDSSQSKPRHENEPSRAQLLEALCHSQTRAREAETAAKKASDEKDHIVKLLIRQASHLFACKQWLKMLELENLCLQLKLKDHPILWMPSIERPSGQDAKNAMRKGEKRKMGGSFCRYVLVFAVGLGLAGAGLLLGWTVGWLLPNL